MVKERENAMKQLSQEDKSYHHDTFREKLVGYGW